MRFINTRSAVAALAAALVFMLGAPTCASLGQDKVPLMHDGYLILRLRVGCGGLTAQQRKTEIQLRMHNLMARQFAQQDQDLVGQVVAKKWGKDMIIGTPDHLLLTVTRTDARANNCDVTWLANYWRNRMVQALIIATRTG